MSLLDLNPVGLSHDPPHLSHLAHSAEIKCEHCETWITVWVLKETSGHSQYGTENHFWRKQMYFNQHQPPCLIRKTPVCRFFHVLPTYASAPASSLRSHSICTIWITWAGLIHCHMAGETHTHHLTYLQLNPGQQRDPRFRQQMEAPSLEALVGHGDLMKLLRPPRSSVPMSAPAMSAQNWTSWKMLYLKHRRVIGKLNPKSRTFSTVIWNGQQHSQISLEKGAHLYLKRVASQPACSLLGGAPTNPPCSFS